MQTFNQMNELDRQPSLITDNVRCLLELHENSHLEHGNGGRVSSSARATSFLSENAFRESVDPLNEGYEQFKKREHLGSHRRSPSSTLTSHSPAFSNVSTANDKIRLLLKSSPSSRSRGLTTVIDRQSEDQDKYIYQVVRRTVTQDFAVISRSAQPFDRVVSVSAKVRTVNNDDNGTTRGKGNDVNRQDEKTSAAAATRHAHRRLDVLSAVSLYDNTRDTTVDNVRYDVALRQEMRKQCEKNAKARKRKQLQKEERRASRIGAAEEVDHHRDRINAVNQRNVPEAAVGTESDKDEEGSEEDEGEYISASPVARSMHESSPKNEETSYSPILSSNNIEGNRRRRQDFVDEASFVNTPPRNVHVYRESARRKTWQRGEEVKEEGVAFFDEKRSPSQPRHARFVGQPFNKINQSNIVDASGLVNDSIFQQIDSALRATSLQKYSEEEGKTESMYVGGKAVIDQRGRELFRSSPPRNHFKREHAGVRKKLEMTTRDGMKNIHYISTYLAKTVPTLEHASVFEGDIVPPVPSQPQPPPRPVPPVERLASSSPIKSNMTEGSAARSSMSFDGDELSSPQPELPFPRRPPPPPFLNRNQQPLSVSSEVTRPPHACTFIPHPVGDALAIYTRDRSTVTAFSFLRDERRIPNVKESGKQQDDDMANASLRPSRQAPLPPNATHHAATASSPSPPPPPPPQYPPPLPQDNASQPTALSALETNNTIISRRLLYSNSREQQQQQHQQHMEDATSSLEDKETENIRATSAERNTQAPYKVSVKSEDEGNSSVFFSAGGLGTPVANRCKQ